MNQHHRRAAGAPLRRSLVCGGATALLLAAAGGPAAVRAQARSASRARFSLARDFSAAPGVLSIVPWAVTTFQSGSDYSLQPDGRIRINRRGLYELVFSSDWDATYGTDIDLRKIGMRRQQRGQADFPTESHERVGFAVIPGSDAPRTARFQGAWGPVSVPLGGIVSIDVTVTPPGTVGPGDVAQAAHTQVRDGSIGAAAVAALQVQAKVVAADTVRVSFYNPLVAEGIVIPAGTLQVLASDSVATRGRNGDAWQVLHSPSVLLEAGDKVYGMMEHKVAGTLLQATKGSYLQIDRLEQ